MRLRSALSGLCCAAAAVVALAGSKAHEVPPRIVSFSPAAVHPGGEFLVDAQYEGTSLPRLRVGGRAVPRSRIRVGESPAEGVRRLWARVPRRAAAGDHEISLATRAGKAVAAKKIEVADCSEEPPAAAGCGNIPNAGVDLVVAGTGYRKVLKTSASVAALKYPGQTVLEVSSAGVGTLNLHIPLDASQIRAGTVSTDGLMFSDSSFNYYGTSDATFQVTEESPGRLGLCFDMPLATISSSTPAAVRLTGFMVVTR